MQQEVAAAREANCLLKLAGPLVTTAANAAMEFDLSQVDMTKVAALFVVFSAGGSGEIKLSANDTVVSSICSNNFYNSAGIALRSVEAAVTLSTLARKVSIMTMVSS